MQPTAEQSTSADSVAEPFGFRWAGAADKYFRTWTDFVFLRPRRFTRRYERNRRRYTKPAVFLIDTLIATAVASWAFVQLHGNAEQTATVRNEIALQTLWVFGQTTASILLAMLALRIVRRRPRVRRLFIAAAYSSALLLLLPFLEALVENGTRNYSNPEGADGVVRIFAVAFSLIHFIYLFAAIAAAHHIRLARVIVGASVVVGPVLAGLLIVVPWDAVLNKVQKPQSWSSAGTINPWLTEGQFAGRGYPLLISTATRAPHAFGWLPTVGISSDVQFVHFRIPCVIEGNNVHDLRVSLLALATENDVTVFKSSVWAAGTQDIVGYGELYWVKGKHLEWSSTSVYYCWSEQLWPLPYSQDGHEVVLRDGLRLGDWKSPGCGVIVVTFRVVPGSSTAAPGA